jgi:gas vesicle protein
MMNMTRNTKIIVGVATAVAAGTAIGLLFGTKKGNAIKDKMIKATKRFSTELSDTIKKNGKKSMIDAEYSAKKLKTNVMNKVEDLRERLNGSVKEKSEEVVA